MAHIQGNKQVRPLFSFRKTFIDMTVPALKKGLKNIGGMKKIFPDNIMYIMYISYVFFFFIQKYCMQIGSNVKLDIF